MITLEQVEKLREYANVSYDEAKAALEKADGDILEALIDLEHQGKVKPPQGGGNYNSANVQIECTESKGDYNKSKDYSNGGCKEKSAFNRNMSKFFNWLGELINKGNINSFVVERKGEQLMKLPVTILALLILFAFWFMVPLLIVGLFFSFRYYFQGPHLDSTKVNDAMDKVANAAEEIKNDIKN